MARAQRANGVQQNLPEMEDSKRRIPAIHNAAEKYVTARDERMALTEKEVETKKHLREVMRKYDLTHYQYEDLEVTIEVAEEKIKVKKAKLTGEDE
ncbi:MAG: hypothetical protein AB1631_30635 [Acidobacteriota bacterium]